jgi:hypothetical protein
MDLGTGRVSMVRERADLTGNRALVWVWVWALCVPCSQALREVGTRSEPLETVADGWILSSQGILDEIVRQRSGGSQKPYSCGEKWREWRCSNPT